MSKQWHQIVLRRSLHAPQVRARCVSRAMQLHSSSLLPDGVEQRIANLYAPNLSSCWGVECVQVGAETATHVQLCRIAPNFC